MKPRVALCVTAILWGLLAFWFHRRGSHPAIVGTLAVLSAALLTLATLFPRLAERVHHLMGRTLNALINGIAGALLLLLYWVILTPAGLCLRWTGTLQVTRKPDSRKPTYWIQRRSRAVDVESYWRTF